MKDACPDCEGLKDTRAIRCQRCEYQRRRNIGQVGFWSLIAKKGDKECWPWVGFRVPGGYGMYNQQAAHRQVYELLIGPIPAAMFVCHHCDNPACCNPAHLFLGTPKDNSQDMVRKGRTKAPRGSKAGASKLIEEQVLAIRERYSRGGISQRALGQQYGVSQRSIHNILTKRTWDWL